MRIELPAGFTPSLATHGSATTPDRLPSQLATTLVRWLLLIGASGAVVSVAGGGPPLPALTACALTLVVGWLAGALLLPPAADTSVAAATLRLFAGLLLTSLAFMAGLRTGLPWACGPLALAAVAIWRYRAAAFALPSPLPRLTWDGAAAGLVALLAVAPLVVAGLRMGEGTFPPQFFNVDTPYFLEQVHSLAGAGEFPPPSLGMAGGRRSYHYVIHALCALVARSSGLPAHQATFLVVLPLLAASVVAAALLLARAVAPTVPRLLALPLLLIIVPNLWYPYSDEVAGRLGDAWRSRQLDPIVASLTGNFELWGVASNNPHNVAAHALVLACLAGVVSAAAAGWRLPVFLAAVAFLVKAPTGVSLLAGLGGLQCWRALRDRQPSALLPAFGAAALFCLLYAIFWIVPGSDGQSSLELYPFYHLQTIQARGALPALTADAGWLLLPGLVLLPQSVVRRGESGGLFACAAASLIVVNTLISNDAAGYSVGDDWLQIVLAVPLVVRAAVLSMAGTRWARLTWLPRLAFVTLAAAAVGPPLVAAGSYVMRLIARPETAHEYVDNRPLAAALATIPTGGTLIVTNDLRYPADGFKRDNRQMQIPAIYGHRAYAANLAYEWYEFSAARRDYQALLREPRWNASLATIAPDQGWTHLLLRHDAPHPQEIPLEQTFDNGVYAVYRFPPAPAPASAARAPR